MELETGRPKQPRVRPSTVEDPKKKKARLNEDAAQEDTVLDSNLGIPILNSFVTL